MILAADIGGTHARFGLYDGERIVLERRLASADFQTVDAALAAFLAEAGPVTARSACFAVAGPIADGGRHAHLTNLPWTVDAPALEAYFGLPALRLVNDFAAAALGAVTATPDQLRTLQDGRFLTEAPRLVVGAGTGLGMALVLPERRGWRVVPGEGGHVAFAPADEAQAALWDFLRRRHGRVTWERVLSGSGLIAIHEHLTGRRVAVTEVGIEALRLFFAAYGAYAGDMALASLARGGVFLAGGIAVRHLDLLGEGGFLAAFRDKAEHADLVAAMPLHAVTNPDCGLRGARLWAGITKP